MVALYRPGPMKNIEEYTARKHGTKPVTYLHPKMKNFLDRTFGVLVYQDDLLMTAIEVAGYSWGEVDKFRKAVGKKIREEMAKQHVKFVEGCVSHGKMSPKKAEELWDLFEPFQGYGFNKAHAASYGKVAYQTAYMKANFPAIYMSAVLTAESGDVDMISEIITECKRMSIKILPPSVNESFEGFTTVKSEGATDYDSIRFGLSTIKNFGDGISQSIITERKTNGVFTSLSDFLRRIKDKNLNKKSLEALIKTGAMDEFGDRANLLHNLDTILTFNKEERGKETAQDSLFSTMAVQEKAEEVHLEKSPETNPTDKLMWEKELLGLYISGHPLDSFKDKLESREKNIKKIKLEGKEGVSVIMGGIIEEIRPVMTKKGEKMVFIKIADLSDSIDAVAFPKVLEEFQDVLIAENCVVVMGKFSTRNGEKSVLIDKVKLME
jgi:DNA polymerase-3 subunit alpha